MERFIIFFCCYFGKLNESDGVIVIYQDSVRAFNTTWMIKEKAKVSTYGEKIHTGIFYLESSDVKATLEIAGPTVRFRIPSHEAATLKQLLHTEELYLKYPELNY